MHFSVSFALHFSRKYTANLSGSISVVSKSKKLEPPCLNGFTSLWQINKQIVAKHGNNFTPNSEPDI